MLKKSVQEKFTAGYWFTINMNYNFVTLKSNPSTENYAPRYRILHSGMLLEEGTKVAVKCNNYPSAIEIVDIDDVVFPSHFIY